MEIKCCAQIFKRLTGVDTAHNYLFPIIQCTSYIIKNKYDNTRISLTIAHTPKRCNMIVKVL